MAAPRQFAGLPCKQSTAAPDQAKPLALILRRSANGRQANGQKLKYLVLELSGQSMPEALERFSPGTSWQEFPAKCFV